MDKETLTNLVSSSVSDPGLVSIAEKIFNKERITETDGMLLFEKGSLSFLGSLAIYIR